MLIAVPSKGRANKVRTLKILPTATLFVPTNEVDAYRTCYPDADIRGVPIAVSGITATRNWILNNAGDDDVVMIDDDVKTCGYLQLNETSGKYVKVTGNAWLKECEKLFAITRAVGYRIWGIATQDALRSVYPYRPFLFQSYVTASFMGICNESGIRFDEDFKVKEDYEINLRCIAEDGGVVAARYLFWQNEHWSTDGGCKDYRTLAMEESCIAKLQEKYPGKVKRIQRGGADVSIELQF
jgi:hypothetical protein